MKRSEMHAAMIGRRFSRLIILEKSTDRNSCGAVKFLAQCDCGKKKTVVGNAVRSGRVESCGCLIAEISKNGPKHKTHGHKANSQSPSKNGSPTYVTWSSMRQRCAGKHNAKYYANLGVSVCKRWESFENFLADMGERPAGKSLDRINPFGNYEPSNCRWATRSEQARNKRNNYLAARGETA